MELTSSTQLPADAVVAAVHTELSKRIAAIEDQLLAVIDGCQATRAATLRDNIALVETLSAGFPVAEASQFKQSLGELRVFLLLFEPYMAALRESKSLHPCVTFDMVDRRTGKKSKAAMPPMTAAAFASDMDKLLKKLSKVATKRRRADDSHNGA